MTINWFGQSCFRLEIKDMSVLIDPFSKEIGLKEPRMGKDDLILTTHGHYDHNNVAGAMEEALVISGPGEYEKGGVQVEGILSYHDDQEGKLRGLNTIYVLRMEGLRICHLGDLGQPELSHEQSEAIGDIDVLFVPVGGKYRIEGKQAVKVIGQIDPKIIIPMHYKIKALKSDMEGLDKFLKEIAIKPEQIDGDYKINVKILHV